MEMIRVLIYLAAAAHRHCSVVFKRWTTGTWWVDASETKKPSWL